MHDFVEWLNESICSDADGMAEVGWRRYGEMVGQSLKRHYQQEREDRDGLRLSELGKPAVVQALKRLGYREPPPKGSLLFIFHLGDVFEHFAGEMMRVYGYEILADQMEEDKTLVEFEGVKGHFDYLVREPKTGRRLLVEVKTMSGAYAQRFRLRPDDERGYVTQLACYHHALSHDVDGAWWLCLDKSNWRAFCVEGFDGLFEGALYRAREVISRMNHISSEEDVLRYFQAPPPMPEVYARRQTGRYMLPPSMRYSPFAEAFYELNPGVNGYGKERLYVDGMKDAKAMQQALRVLVDEGRVLHV